MRGPGVAALLILFSAGLSEAGTITIGTDSTENAFPVGASIYFGEYQQIYTNTAFSGPVDITGVAFSTVEEVAATTTLTFTLSLSTTPLSNLTAPSTDYAANRGADFTQVFSGTLTFTPLTNGTFDFVVNTAPFAYDPSLGALLVDIDVTSPFHQGFVTFEANRDGTTARVYNSFGTDPPTPTVGTPSDSTGLVTQFTVSPLLAETPEPSSIVMLGLGLASLVAVQRYRKRRRS